MSEKELDERKNVDIVIYWEKAVLIVGLISNFKCHYPPHSHAIKELKNANDNKRKEKIYTHTPLH